MTKMKEKIRQQKDNIIKLEVKVDEQKKDMQEIKMENSQLCFVAGPDYLVMYVCLLFFSFYDC